MANPVKIIKGLKKVTKTPGVKGRGTKSTTIKEPKSNVRVKPAAKQSGNPLNNSQYKYQSQMSAKRASNNPFQSTPGTRRQNSGKTKSFRKFMSKNPNVYRDELDKFIGPKKQIIKINSNPKRGK